MVLIITRAQPYSGSVLVLFALVIKLYFGKYVFMKTMNVDTYFLYKMQTRHASFTQTKAYTLIVNVYFTTNYMPVPTPNYYCTFFVLALVFSTFFFASCLVLSLCDIFVFFFKTEYNHITLWSCYDNEILNDQNGVTTHRSYKSDV